MKLTADNEGRIGCRELFTPRKTFDASRQADGSIRIVELADKAISRARLVRREGRTYLETDHTITNEDTQAIMSQFP
jgi:hypothetical protein